MIGFTRVTCAAGMLRCCVYRNENQQYTKSKQREIIYTKRSLLFKKCQDIYIYLYENRTLGSTWFKAYSTVIGAQSEKGRDIERVIWILVKSKLSYVNVFNNSKSDLNSYKRNFKVDLAD